MWLLLQADSNDLSYKDSIALWISLLAIIISFLAYLNTKKSREPRVSLTTSFHTRLVGDRQTNVLKITVTNTGPVDVTVEDIGLEGIDGKTLRPKWERGDVQLPLKLEPSQPASITYMDDELTSASSPTRFAKRAICKLTNGIFKSAGAADVADWIASTRPISAK